MPFRKGYAWIIGSLNNGGLQASILGTSMGSQMYNLGRRGEMRNLVEISGAKNYSTGF